MQELETVPKKGISLFEDHKIFYDLEKSDKELLLEISTIIKKNKNDFVFMQGDKVENFYIVLTGNISIYSETSQGREIFTTIISKGEIIGESSILHKQTYDTHAQALNNATLLAIPTHKIRSLLQSNATLAFHILTMITNAYSKLTAKMERNFTMLAPQRLGCFLLKLDKSKTSNKSYQIKFPYEKRIIANYLQMTPETFSRAIKHLTKHGVNISKETAIINDINKLREFSCNNCTRLSDEEFETCQN